MVLKARYRSSSTLHVDGGAELGASEDSVGAELFLDAQNLVELSETLRAGWCTGFLHVLACVK